jgi:hypothetical protein
MQHESFCRLRSKTRKRYVHFSSAVAAPSSVPQYMRLGSSKALDDARLQLSSLKPSPSNSLNPHIAKNGRWRQDPLPKARLVAIRRLVRAASQLESQHRDRRARGRRLDRRRLEDQRRARSAVQDARARCVLPEQAVSFSRTGRQDGEEELC